MEDVILPDENAQVRFGEALGEALQGQGLVYLEGDLGAGKTTLTRGVLRAYGHTGAVKSPTYTLVEPYQLARVTLYHFDLYRLGDPEELEFMGARDLLGEGNVSLVEWPGRGEGWLPLPDLWLHLGVMAPGRRVSMVAYSEHGKLTLQQLTENLAYVYGPTKVSHGTS
ncbi:tRNA (adenosine(37)-N6)-threonylcarbamoyltransferase complex ATPase subunit type 1 TsaE [Aidingimonas lacisalsi]|uniref:tRNA (adenosine(37)-N6)-threonylcarbamoyltransferase complex ATPase subunit type 1 TsaE n=1 Tax=Aidingimonas lacisalsi TaxID=2604086 RepID=UPI0011D29C78|nr:tRNA (adenosine(37)-N6)-threonylcarbamoyltransferase complex ATPase subunit type 1 TsaE [Aidingimonas lacisalsi]